MKDLCFDRYRIMSTPIDRAAFRERMEIAGYYPFYTFVEDLRAALKTYGDSDIDDVGSLLTRVRTDFPNPGRFSPSWDKVWDEYDDVYRAKNETLAAIPASERNGEWQVLLDNPYFPQQVVCYPQLSFEDAGYMYAYFQKDLKPNEYLRLQRVTHRLVTTGNKEASIWPDR